MESGPKIVVLVGSCPSGEWSWWEVVLVGSGPKDSGPGRQ